MKRFFVEIDYFKINQNEIKKMKNLFFSKIKDFPFEMKLQVEKGFANVQLMFNYFHYFCLFKSNDVFKWVNQNIDFLQNVISTKFLLQISMPKLC